MAMHTWREIASQTYAAFVGLFGPLLAKQCKVHNVPPKALVGRWGKASECQHMLNTVGTRRLGSAMGKALSASADKHKRKYSGVDELSIEEVAHMST